MGPSITVTWKLRLQRMLRAQPRGLLVHHEGLGWYQSPRRCSGLPSILHISPTRPGYRLWLGTAAWGRGRLPSAPTGHGCKSLSFTMMHFKDSFGSWGKSSFHKAPWPCSSTSHRHQQAFVNQKHHFFSSRSVILPKSSSSHRYGQHGCSRSHQQCFVPALPFPQGNAKESDQDRALQGNTIAAVLGIH